MEPNSNNSEAKRWLSTAVKLLNFRDLHGTRGFAIRALESDPRLEGAEQIIALAEVLLAGSSRIGDDQQLCDYYAVLQVPRHTQNLELIASQYRRFALLLSPNVNRLPFADEAFNLVSEAWVVLSNHSKKVLYDNELNICYSRLGFGAASGLTHQLHPHEQPQPQPPPPPQHHQEHHFPFLQPQAQAQAQPQIQPQPQPLLQPQPQPQPQPTLNSQQLQQEQQHQEQQQMRRSPKRTQEEERPNLNNVAESTQQTRQPTRVNEQEPTQVYETPPTRASPVVSLGMGESYSEIGPSFWTACPYCYILYEYPKGYEECALLCQSCKRAFQAVMIQSPPVTEKGDIYFCSWGFFPLGFSGNDKELGASSSNWMPFSPIFACPLQPKGKKGRSAPKFTYNDDDDDIFVEISDDSDDSDEDWGRTRGKRRANNLKRSSARVSKRIPAVTQNGGSDEVPDGVTKVVSAGAGTGASGAALKKKGKAKWGRLDLNVEFSNEGEEPAPGTSEGHVRRNRDEDNIEGIGFFEGLDEFLSSLPILNAVGDEKAKAS